MNNSRRITIKDIAKDLNLHHSTVSRALRNNPSVKKETRDLVLAHAKKQGYQINEIARALRGDKRNTIAVIVPNINHQFFANVISYFTNLSSKNGFVVSIFQTNEKKEREIEIIDTIIQHHFSGVVASISMESLNSNHFNKLLECNIPLVMFDRVGKELDVPKVVINNRQIMHSTVALLQKKGYKKIAHISGPNKFSVFGERQIGYKESLAEIKSTYINSITLNKGFENEKAANIVNKLLNESSKPDAIICDSLMFAIEIINELKNRNLQIPKDLGIVVFGNNPILSITNPSIASIQQPCKKIAEHAFDLLKNKLENKDAPNKTVQLAAKIVIGDSI